MIIDTHAHVNFNAFKYDTYEVISRSLAGDVWMINVGSQYTTSKRAIAIAERYPNGVYATVGLHPIHLETGLVKGKIDKEEIEFKTTEEIFDYEKYKELALSSKKVVAIGEVGLDYYYKPKTKTRMDQFKEKQRTVLSQQIELAKDINLPVIFHCRAAHNDLLGSLERLSLSNSGVVHCFTGTWEDAKKYIDMGFYIGFNGIIFKLPLDEVILKTPLDNILLETDCPYLTPPEAGVKRNEPMFVKHVAQKIAQIKKISYEEIISVTTQNAKTLFSI